MAENIRNDGTQVDYETTLKLKQNANPDVLLTSDDYYNKKKKEESEEALHSLSIEAGAGASIYATSSLVNKNENLRDLFSKFPGANRYSKKHDIARNYSKGFGYDPIDLTQQFKSQSFGRSLQSIIASTEELSPLGLLRTLQVSSLVEPFINPDIEDAGVHIKGNSIVAYEDFYNAMIERASQGKKKLTDNNLKHGFFLKDGILYSVQPDGSLDYVDPVLKHAKLVTTHINVGDSIAPNRILSKLANVYGTKIPYGAYTQEQMVVVGSNSKANLISDWSRSYIRQAMEIGYKTFDNPIAGFEDILNASGVNSSTGLTETNTYKTLKKVLSPQLGTGGDYSLSTRQSVSLLAKNTTTKLVGAAVAYQGIDYLLDKITPEDSAWNDGIVSGLTANYANLRVTAAKLYSDRFQSYKESQEEAADGSTNLITLLGFPIAGATLGASMSYGKRLLNSGRLGIEQASNLAVTPRPHGSIFEPLFTSLGIESKTPVKGNALKGAALGALVALPFLPGALIGKSSDELKKEYSGEEEVANRANRYWLAGGNSYFGEQIKNFQPGFVAQILSNAKDEVNYNGDESLKAKLNPLFSPIQYLRNPYKFEEMHREDMPYPVWGMDVSAGSFLGRIFQGTLGEIIKPTVVNERFLQESTQIVPQVSQEEYDRIKDNYDSVNLQYSKAITNPETNTEELNKLMLDVNQARLAYTAIKNSNVDSNGYSVISNPRDNERALIESGMMLREDTPYVNPKEVALSKAYAALTDFTGMKGFSSSLFLDASHLDPSHTRLQLARSGTATSVDNSIRDANLGDMLGLGEFQRRMVPTSASSKQDYLNPMSNTLAADWLPQDESKYFINFKKGNYYDKVSNAEFRLPGKGLEALHPELEGLNPNDYPLVYQYKVLSDVANGSPEQISMKEYLLEKANNGELKDSELDLFYKTLTQEQAKATKRDFSEYKTEEEKSKLSLTGQILNTIWEKAAHNSESVIEPLTPFRPASKFIHKRSAIEDYEKTQLQGPDTGIWTSPYEHFIRPSFNKTRDLITGEVHKPIEAEERDNVEEYFDKLEYLKARKNGKINDALRTTIGASYAGIYDTASFNKFKSSLSDDQKLYLDSFSKATDPKDRERILEMLPTDVGRAYSEIWNNLSIAEQAKSSGQDPVTAIKKQYIKDTPKYVKMARGKSSEVLTDEEILSQASKEKSIEKGSSDLSKEDEAFAKSREERLRAADIEAENYVKERTGVPDDNWIGWDPRLKLDEVKLRTLTVGGADMYKYGFWQSDLQRNERIVALDNESQITESYNVIKKQMINDRERKQQIENTLFSNGILARRIHLSDAGNNDLRMVINRNDEN